MERYVFVQDESSHWYLLPEKERDNFDDLLYSNDEALFMERYWKYVLGQHISNIPIYRAEDVETNIAG